MRFLLEEARKGKLRGAAQGRRPVPVRPGRRGAGAARPSTSIPFEIVPGITSAIAVPAYNGIPVTHRDFCSSLHIITAHKKADEPLDIDFEALVRTKGTLGAS